MTRNTGAVRMFGFEESEIVGQPFELLYPPDEREHGVRAKNCAGRARKMWRKIDGTYGRTARACIAPAS